MVAASKEACAGDSRKLGTNEPCSYNKPAHYSLDFAQQVHLPHDPMQPGLVYFLVSCKVGIFGICCEGLSKQVNFLIDEMYCTSKRSVAVISYIHYFFKNYGLGEGVVTSTVTTGAAKTKIIMFWLISCGAHSWGFISKCISIFLLLATQSLLRTGVSGC